MVDDDVTVAEYEVVDVGVVGEVVGGESYDRVGGRERCRLVGLAVKAAVTRPSVGESNCPAGVDSGVEALGNAVAEQTAHQSVGSTWFADAVAVFEQECVGVDLAVEDSIVDGDSDFVFEVVEEPDVVVAFEPDDFNARVG